MLTKIDPHEIKIGMYVHAFEGSWFDHPFWRSKFLIETPEEVLRIKNAAISGVLVDKQKSLADAFAPPSPKQSSFQAKVAPRAIAPKPGHHSLVASAPAPALRPAKRTAYARECQRAQKAIDKSKNAVADMFESARLGKAINAKGMVPLARSINDSILRDSRAMLNLVRLKNKDEYTYLHSVAVGALMINFGRYLKMDEDVIESLGVAGLLHDVGKISIADTILLKPGALSDIERNSVKSHPLKGHYLLSRSKDVPELALEICLRHHEKVDGSGYPDRFNGDLLSVHAKMGAICDVYDAITSDRPYKAPWTPCEALAEMQSWTGHFDERLLQQFSESIGIYPVGTLVQLSGGELGVVMGNAGDHAEAVVVRRFFSIPHLEEIPLLDRIIGPDNDDTTIIGRDRPEFWRIDNWDEARIAIMAAQI